MPAENDPYPVETGGSMIYTRTAVVVVAFLLSQAPCDAATQPQTYTKKEIDTKLGNLRAEIAGKKQSIADIDAKLQELRELMKQTLSRPEVDAKINAIQQVVTAYKKGADDQEARIWDELKATNLRIPSAPWWAASLVSLVAAAGSIIVSWVIARANRAQTDVQRAEGEAQSLIDLWAGSFDKVGRALGALEQLQYLENPDTQNEVRAVGNIYDRIGTTWRKGGVGKKMLQENNMKDQAKTFWDHLVSAQHELAKNPNNSVNLDKPIADWKDLKWLATAT
jgi:hypothetical protein